MQIANPVPQDLGRPRAILSNSIILMLLWRFLLVALFTGLDHRTSVILDPTEDDNAVNADAI